MGLLKLAIVFGAIVVIAKSIQFFSRHARRQYRHSFFAARGFWLAAIGINLTWWGYIGWGTALLHHEPTWGGLVLIAMGIAAVVRLIYENIRNTGPIYGFFGSILQLVLFFPVALYGIPLLAITLLFCFSRRSRPDQRGLRIMNESGDPRLQSRVAAQRQYRRHRSRSPSKRRLQVPLWLEL
ncbi:hypothetical protein [Burkholderia cepacia]|uniref:hypothetical protein n=1 Tax=Burkholderia cepacia TaxID=292 RepID=UPI002ED9599F